MIHLFSKKHFLVDQLENFVDIHNHILPGIDDGAKTVEDSLALIKGFSEFGVKNFVATPHIMHNYYPNTKESIEKAHGKVKNELVEMGMDDIELGFAAEHMIDENFIPLVEKGDILPLRKGYLLVEMSYLQPPIHFDEAIVKVASNHQFPVLAHPERYAFLHQRFGKYKKFRAEGILFQLNLLSLSNYYGKEIPKIAHRLLEENMIDFIGSDVHNMQQLQSLKEVTISRKIQKMVTPVIHKTIETFY
ncbi:tyrosine-protein phosphatase [Zeaxanthinibacter enoshimensis]|uniref:protein-tyrosine-phosphatase n=1 Tax=Zeaxanthinibacter enoshimensis TaxID=392009 RepID=A0A4R6TL19_9FLAO|nr:CpsB/CapC family capsule biosynthesis tyrosine phosphatase [Zeaxanthinibacter enoshimensis]TDQ31182.1 tyrosine-protein phosphatase YwqE [Zeaxanthinibacter enoshimensis]